MVELPKTSPEEEAHFPLRGFPVVKPAETVEVSEELREEGVEKIELPEERFEVSENGQVRPFPEKKISIPGDRGADVQESKRWLGELGQRLRLKRQLGKP